MTLSAINVLNMVSHIFTSIHITGNLYSTTRPVRELIYPGLDVGNGPVRTGDKVVHTHFSLARRDAATA